MQRYRAVRECALDIYLESRLINRIQHRAGLRFREAYHRTASCRTTEINRNGIYENHSDATDERLTMSENLIRQARNELNPENWHVVEDVCGLNRILYSPRAYEALRKGLGHLAVEWNMAAVALCNHRKK